MKLVARLAGLGCAVAAATSLVPSSAMAQPAPSGGDGTAKATAAANASPNANAGKDASIDVGAPGDEIVGDEAGKKRPAAEDTRLGHIFIHARTGFAAPAGSVSTNVGAGDLAATGPLVGGILGFGIGRNAVIQATGNYAFLNAPSLCSICARGSSYDGGIGFRYHLTQGFAFDPWASYGLAYRSSTFDVVKTKGLASAEHVSERYRGLDLVRLAFGADFYPIPQLGLGPYLGVDIGTNYSRPTLPNTPAGAVNAATTYAFFEIGLQVSFDPLKTSSRRTTDKKSAKR